MREDELRQVLAARSAGYPDCPDRLAGVRRKVAGIRRRRVAGMCGVAVAAVVAGAGVPVAHRLGGPAAGQLRPAHVGALPLYHQGGRLVGWGVLQPPATQVSFQVTPTSTALSFAAVCPTDQPDDTDVVLNRHVISQGACPSFVNAFALDPGALRSFGVTPGQPFTLTIRRTGGVTGAVVVGVWQQVPPGQYPLPPHPRGTVGPPGPDRNEPANFDPVLFRVVADPRRPNGTVTRTVVLSADLGASLRCAAPGTLTIRLDGRVVETLTCWDYQLSGIAKVGFVAPELDPATAGKVGHRVRLTITAERFTDPAWRVDVGHLR